MKRRALCLNLDEAYSQGRIEFVIVLLAILVVAMLIMAQFSAFLARRDCFAKYSRIGHPVSYQLPGGCFLEPYPGIFIPADQYEYPNFYPMLQPTWRTSP